MHGSIFAAPVIGADGSIYVVSSIHYTDHRDGVANKRNDSYLHKFTSDGGWLFAIPFPERYSASPTIKNRGATTAPPNIWRANGIEAVMVPAVYRGYGGKELHLVAFSTSGDVLADEFVSVNGEITSDWEPDDLCGAENWWNLWIPCVTFWFGTGIGGPTLTNDAAELPLAGAGLPLPGVAIRPDPSGGPPFVMVTDGRHDKVAYAFSPQAGFSQVARSSHLLRQFTTPPVVLPNGDTLTGTLDGYLTRTGQNFVQLGALYAPGSTLTAAPTRLSDGGLVVVSREGIMTVQRGHRSQRFVGESIASAAASCNHIFVASINQLSTFDARTLMLVATASLGDGGLHSPVIGPQGHVYAVGADDGLPLRFRALHVFPPPWRPVWDTSLPSCALLPPTPGPLCRWPACRGSAAGCTAGGGGRDIIEGGNGDDVISGGAGNDLL